MKSKFVGVSVLAISLISSEALAACSAGTTLFSCTAKNNKVIELCDLGKTIKYSYGAARKPEIALLVPRESVSRSMGMGRWASYSIIVPNGATEYMVSWSYERTTEEHEIEAGVSAIVNDEVVAHILCKNDTIDQRLDSVDFKPYQW